MKKLLSTAMAVIISTSAMLSINSHAVEYCSERGKMTYCLEVIEYLETPFVVYWDGGNYLYSIEEELMSFGTLYMNLGCYIKISDEEFALLTEYVSSNYPELTVDSDNRKLIYKDVYTRDEMFDISVEIKEELGLICDYYTLFDIQNVSIVGDLNSDNTITASDAAMALSYYASGQTTLAVASDEEAVDYSLIADYNNDGMVTAVDAALILSDYAQGQVS